jgi:hypothetical protein
VFFLGLFSDKKATLDNHWEWFSQSCLWRSLAALSLSICTFDTRSMFFRRYFFATRPAVVLVVILQCFLFNHGLVGVPVPSTHQGGSLFGQCVRATAIFQALVGGVRWSMEVIYCRQIFGAGSCSTRVAASSSNTPYFGRICV